MAVLVHITDARHERAIRRGGLKAGRSGLHAVPVTGDYLATHQWARELKRWGARTPIAVYFRMPGATPVSAGSYHETHRALSLSEALSLYLARESWPGFEVIFDAGVPKRAILRIKPLRRPVGWRYYPAAKGRYPLPGPLSRGDYGAARTRARLES